MFKPFRGQCYRCPEGLQRLILTRRGLCQQHLAEYKESNKSPERKERERLKKEQKLKKQFEQAWSKKRTPIKKKHKTTGEREVYEEIWQTRLHNCEVCDKPIIRKKNGVRMFSHVSSKGSNVVLRLDPEFIVLMGDGINGNCDHHEIWEHRTDEMRNDPMWKPFFLLLDAAKKKGHELRKNKPLYTEKSVYEGKA